MARKRAPQFMIFSGEHLSFWNPACTGYTRDPDLAGRWYRRQAERFTRHCGPEKLIALVEVRRNG